MKSPFVDGASLTLQARQAASDAAEGVTQVTQAEIRRGELGQALEKYGNTVETGWGPTALVNSHLSKLRDDQQLRFSKLKRMESICQYLKVYHSVAAPHAESRGTQFLEFFIPTLLQYAMIAMFTSKFVAIHRVRCVLYLWQKN